MSRLRLRVARCALTPLFSLFAYADLPGPKRTNIMFFYIDKVTVDVLRTLASLIIKAYNLSRKRARTHILGVWERGQLESRPGTFGKFPGHLDKGQFPGQSREILEGWRLCV